jgi:PAS domain S-box-containing protein
MSHPDSSGNARHDASSRPTAPDLNVPVDTDSAEWLRVTLSSIGDGVITTDGQGLVTFLNPIAQELTGWTQDKAFGIPLQTVFRIVNEDTRAEVENPALRALREGVVVGLANHTLLIALDGTERPIDDSAAPIRNTAGRVAGTVLVFRDVTERRAAKHTLKESEVRYRRLFQTAKDGILILDAATGKITDANAFMSALVGLEPAELLGKELFEIGMFRDIEENKAAFRELLQNRYLRHEHLPVQNQRGERVEVEFIANVYEQGRRTVAQCNVRDISERVKLEAKIKEQAQALADESLRKDEFLAMLSHELRNPLAPIRSAVHLLKASHRGGESPIHQQAREIIERQVANLTKLISDLLEVSRVVSGRIRLNLQLLDLNQVAGHALETITPIFEQRRHKVRFVPCDHAIWVRADPPRMEEVLVNLFNNAAKYTPDHGTISISCEHPRGENHAAVRVKDSGVGLEPSLLEKGRIFDLFTQGDRSLDRADGGLGIGLSLVHRLVSLHGGTVEARSEGQGRGSEFIVRLPLEPTPEFIGKAGDGVLDDSSRHPAVSGHPFESPFSGLRILVVDDNVDLVTMVVGSLRLKGHSVRSEHTGPAGLATAQQWRPDVILLDIGLPGLDGYEVARRLRSRSPDGSGALKVRIIALTGYGRETDIALAREAGFDGHMIKPYDFDELEKMIRGST